MAAFDKRFFESTRGQIVKMLRSGGGTVEELSTKLKLTDNAVRAHLATLERDGLVRQSGLRRGPRKPHFTYVLTDEADRLFPKAYDSLLNQLLTVLKTRLSGGEIEGILRDTGRGMVTDTSPAASLEKRVQRALKVLEAIGGAAKIERHGNKFAIQSSGCPLAEAVSVHPEVCHLAESLVAEIVKAPVHEVCDRSGRPKCRFEIGSEKAKR